MQILIASITLFAFVIQARDLNLATPVVIAASAVCLVAWVLVLMQLRPGVARDADRASRRVPKRQVPPSTN